MSLPASCKGCPLYHPSKNFVPMDGVAHKKVLVIGEAPGEQEAAQGKPFIGTSGKLLERILHLAGLSREDFAVHNVLSCRPPNNELRGAPYEKEAIDHCDQHLRATIERVKPKVIIALGNTPLQALTGFSGITRYRGYPLPGPSGSTVVPTYHPSFLLPRRGQKSTSHLTPAVVRDIKLAVEIAENGFSRPEVTYLEDPSLLMAEKFCEDYEQALLENGSYTYLSWDIETPHKLDVSDEEQLEELDSEVIRISFCFRPGYSMSIPWNSSYMPIIRRLLGSEGAKVNWNGWHFDEPIVSAQGVHIGGASYDGMWAWHYLMPDLPRGLESASSFYFNGMPWKHESKARPAWYSCVDPDAALQVFLGVKSGLEKTGRWEGYINYVVELQPYLKEAGDNGVRIDKRQRRSLYKKARKVERELIRAIQPLVPRSAKPLKRYKRYPQYAFEHGKEVLEVKVPGTVKVCTACGAYGVTKGTHTGRKGGKQGIPLNPCYKAQITEQTGEVSEWDVVMDFNPSSSDQIINLLHAYGHPVGRNPKTGSETVDDNHLNKLERQYGKDYPIYALIREIKEVRTIISRYVIGMAPNAQGVVETVYTNAPASGRLSSKGYKKGNDKGTNLQNIPHAEDNPWAHDVRKMIVPPPGYVFVEADSSAIEAVITGYLMGDSEFIDIARKSIYAYVACKELGIPFNDENVKVVKKKHKAIYDKKKRTVLGVLYGMGPGLMAILYPETYASKYDAQKEIDFLYAMLPKLAKFHHKVRVDANHDTYLQNGWGYRRYFYDVFKYARHKDGSVIVENGKPKVVLGEDGKACVAQQPQSSAAFFIRENARNVGREIKERNLPFILPGTWLVHDAIMLAVPNTPEDIKEAEELLIRHMFRPIPQLGGLKVGVAVSKGENWACMETIRIVTADSGSFK